MLIVENISCRRNMRVVLRDVAFALSAGDCLLVTGANGSGKSTLLRALAGLMPLAGGRILWQSAPIDDAYSEQLHYIGHHDAVKPELTVAEMVGYWEVLGGLSQLIGADILSAFGLTHLRPTPIRRLSAGQKRRLALTRLLFGDAPLWLLDEPTTALDRQGQGLLLELIASHRAKGGLAVIASHDRLELPQAQSLTLSPGAA